MLNVCNGEEYFLSHSNENHISITEATLTDGCVVPLHTTSSLF